MLELINDIELEIGVKFDLSMVIWYASANRNIVCSCKQA